LKLISKPERNALLLTLALLSGAGATFAYRSSTGLRVAPAVVVASAPIMQVADTLQRGETLSQLFSRRGAGDVNWAALASAVRNFNPSRVKNGTVFTFAQRHGAPVPHAVMVRVAYDTRMHMERTAGGWAARTERIAWRTEPLVLSGSIRASGSVSDAITEAIGDDVLPRDDRIMLVWSLADVYDWTLDFTRDIQPGDRFRVLAERMVSAEGEVRFSRVLAAEIINAGRPLAAYRFDTPDGKQEFYDENGRSLRREFLRAPIEFRRISSGFSKSRMHPILRYRRAHLGLDFGAAYGAPIRSVGRGTVTHAGRMGGYGNLVEVRHNGTTTTRYAHLSGYARGIRAGARVEQGEIIGYVGASGLATAPHLHYELRINGRAVNPVRRREITPGQPVPAGRREEFDRERSRLLGLMAAQPGTRIAD
jgi:murein DD-endopeptidase MepM/ murein hydrolase activator NlpD